MLGDGLLRVVRRVVHGGVYDGMPRQDAKHVILANEISLSLIVANLVLVLNPHMDDVAAGTRAIVIAQCVGLALALLLNARGARSASVFVQLLVSNVIVGLQAAMQSQETQARVYFVALAVVPWLILPARQRWGRIAWTTVALAAFIVIALSAPRFAQATRASPDALRNLGVSNEVVCLVVLAVLGFYSARQTHRVEGELQGERARSEALLLNILPARIAERLKDGGGAIAERFDEATVLFADIVRFTSLAEVMTPPDLVSLLDRVFTRFDELADRYGLEKIKTVGDAYMLAGGVPEPRADHVEAVADAALAMRHALDEVDEARARALSMRIGMHTGPVVAGVIGKRKFLYDLWGDTVNVASRMESHGEGGKIQVSEAVYARLKDRYDLEARPTIAVKGKGELRTWFLLAKRSD